MSVMIPEAAGALAEGGEAGAAGGAPAAASKSAPVSRRGPSKDAPGRRRGAPAIESPRAKAPAKKAPAPKKATTNRPPAPKKKAPAKRTLAQRGKLPAFTQAGPKAKKHSLIGEDGGGSQRIIAAEFIACVFLIGVTPIVQRNPQNGHLYVADDFLRLTAVCGLFFVLALTGNTARGSKLAAAFGGLVTLGVLYNTTNTLTSITKIFTGAQTAKGSEVAASAGTDVIQTATYTPVALNVDPSNPTGTPVAGSTAGGPVSA
jgi:hypothetical protein